MTPLEQARALHAECPSSLWRAQSGWVAEHYPQEVLFETSCALSRFLHQSQEDEELSDRIRDELDVFWYALDAAHVGKLEAFLSAGKDEEP